MLVLLVRLLFVVFAVLVGTTQGGVLWRDQPPWFGGAIGFGVAVTLIAAEQAFRRRFTRSIVAFIIGLAAGLGLSLLMVLVLRQVVQDADLANRLDVPVTLTITYLVLILVLHNVDRWRLILPFVEFHTDQFDGGALVIDPGMLADARLPGLLKTGLFTHRLLVHRDVLNHWETEMGSDDPIAARKATVALECLANLRAQSLPTVEIDETEIPHSGGLHDTLIRLARLENARLMTCDRDLARQAEAEGVSVLDINALAGVLAPQLKPGQEISVLISKPGEGKQQGIGYRDDGSMVVVTGAHEHIGQTVHCVIARLHSTSNGRMIFADLGVADGGKAASGTHKAASS